jgi:hypothetical protein
MIVIWEVAPCTSVETADVSDVLSASINKAVDIVLMLKQ